MNTKLFFHHRLFLNIVLLLTLAVGSSNRSVNASTPCSDSYCFFIPYVNSPAPVKITELGTGCVPLTYYAGAAGNVVTTTPNAVYDVNIEIRAFDQNNEFITSTLTTPVFTATLPDQRNPFEYFLLVDCTQVARMEVEIVSWNMTSDIHYMAPTIVMTNTVQIINGARVGVTIRNDTDQPITNLQGMVWNRGDLEGSWPEPIADYLAPGVTMTFTDTIWTVGGPGPGPFAEPIWIAVQGITEP